MTKTKEEVDKEFGEVVTRRCSFCNKTYDTEKFYAIPDTDGSYSFLNLHWYLLMEVYFQMVRKKQKK